MTRSFACRFAARLALALPFTLLFACSAGTGDDTGSSGEDLKVHGQEDGGWDDGGFEDGGGFDSGFDGGRDGGHHGDGGRDGGHADGGELDGGDGGDLDGGDGGECDGGDDDGGEDGGEADAGYACLQYAIVEINDTCNDTQSGKAEAEASCAGSDLALEDWSATVGSCPEGTFSQATYACCGAGVSPIFN